MSKLFAILFLLVGLNTQAALNTFTVTVTNVPLPGAGTNIVVGGVTRNWTNAHSASGIQTNSASVSASATNLFKSWAFFPQTGVTVYQTETNVVSFRGLDLTLEQGGTWASVVSNSTASATITGTTLPLSVGQASQMWTNLNTASTNRGIGRIDLTSGVSFHGLGLVATNYTLTTNDLYLGADTRSNTNLILTLPSATTASNLLFFIKDEGGAGATNTLKIYPASSQRIDGATNLVVSNNFGSVMLRSQGGTNWAILSSGTGTGTSSGSGISSVSLTNSVWVSKNGSDSTGARGDVAKPYLTLGAAKTNAVSGDTIFVMPGAYTYGGRHLLKTGVNWHFFDGTSVIYTGSIDAALFDAFSGGSFVSTISGYAEFSVTNSGVNVVAVDDNSSNVKIQCRSMTLNTGDSAVAKIGNGSLTISDAVLTSQNRPAVRVDSGSGSLFMRNSKAIRLTQYAPSPYGSGAAMEISASTNIFLRDCVFIGYSNGSNTAYSVIGGGGDAINLQGTLTANLGMSGVTVQTNDTGYVWLPGNATVPGHLNVTGNSAITGTNSASVGMFGSADFTNNISAPTNTAAFTIDATDFALDTNYTNGSQRAHVSASLSLISTNGADAVVALYLDQDANATFEQTGIMAQLGRIDSASVTNMVTNIMQLSAWIQPGGVFAFTNLSTTPSTAAVVAGSSQWVKQ